MVIQVCIFIGLLRNFIENGFNKLKYKKSEKLEYMAKYIYIYMMNSPEKGGLCKIFLI